MAQTIFRENIKKSSVPSGILPENAGNQQKIAENSEEKTKSLTISSILPADQDGESFFISGVAFPSRESALKRVEKFQNEQKNCFIGTASYSRKEEKIQFATRLTGFSLNFNSKVLFDSSQALLRFLPEGAVCPDGKGCVYISWLFDGEYKIADTDALFSELKEIFAGRATVTPRIPWNSYSRKEKLPGEVSLNQFEKGLGRALDKLMEAKGLKKPANMALEAPESPVEGRSDSRDASMAVEDIEVNEDGIEKMEVVEGEQGVEIGMEVEQEMEMLDTKPEAENDTLRFIRTITPEGELIHVRSLGGKSGVSACPDNKFFSDPKKAALHAQAMGEKKWDVYLATASFKDDSSGTKDNFRSACSCPIDFDVAAKVDAKHYGTKADALAGMQRVKEKLFGDMEASPLVIVDSGNGIQAHVILTENVDVDVRKRLGTKIEKVCIALGEKPDKNVTKDAVRIMRVPGTFNYKGFKDGAVKPVACLEWNSGKVAPSELESRLDELLGGDEEELISPFGGVGADDPVMKNLLGNDEPFVLAQNQTAITSLLEALNPDDEDHWRWALKLYKGCKHYAEASKDELNVLWKQIMEWSSRFSRFKDEEQWVKMETQGLCHPRGVFWHFQQPEEEGGIGWKNPGADGVEIKTDAGEPLHNDVAKVVGGLARELSMDVDKLAQAIRLKPDLINSVIASSGYNPTNRKYTFLTKKGELRVFEREQCITGIVGTWGSLYDIEALEEIVRDTMEKPSDTKVAKKSQAIYRGLLDHIMVKRQFNSISVKVDMFTDVASVRIREGVATLTYPHVEFEEGPIDEAVVTDYREHWGVVDRFLDLLAAARFAAARKKAYLWLKADSDWGKGLLEDALKELGLVVSISVAEIEKVFTGGPVGRQLNDFKRSWVLLVNEFKSNKAELKELEQSISFSPKNQPIVSAELFLKLFTSAELVDSLGSEASGIEDQFANRFSMIKASGSIDSRQLFDASRKKYLDSLTNFFARELNRRVSEYRALGRGDAADKGDKAVNAFHREFGISKEYKRLSGKIEDLAKDFLEWIMDEYLSAKDKQGAFVVNGVWTKTERAVMDRAVVDDKDGRKHLYVKQSETLRTIWLEETISPAERGKLLFKRDAFKQALPAIKKLHPTKTRKQCWAMFVGDLSGNTEAESETLDMVA